MPAATGRPEKFCALHYANYIWSANVVEIMPHAATARATLETVTRFGLETGMVPIPIAVEHNGYVINTWFPALLKAAQTLVTNGIATPEDVDRTFLIANRGARMGPFGTLPPPRCADAAVCTARRIGGQWRHPSRRGRR